jgi:hypothetical protein
MKITDRPKLALAAVVPAMMVPVASSGLRHMPDVVAGGAVGVFLGLSVLLMILSVKPKAA